MKISVRYKMLISFSFVFFIGIIALIYSTEKIINNNNEYIIEKEMKQVRKDIDIYLKQYFILNDIQPNKSVFKVEGKDITEELSYKIGDEITLYSQSGEILWDSYAEKDNKDSHEDLKLALKGKTSYSINKRNSKTFVSLSCPITLDNNNIGILRYTRDYTRLYKGNDHIINTIKIIAITLFLFIVLLSSILAKHITRPIIKLQEASRKVEDGDFEVKIRPSSKDEIGELAKSFKSMVDTIKEQIVTIKKDRDTLKELEMSRKIFFDNVTHELKTPITTILGYSQIIEENGFTDEEFFKKGIGHVIQESERLNRMVVELLNLSKNTYKDFSYEFTTIDLSNILNSTCEEMIIKAKRYNMVIKSKIEYGIKIKGDRDKLKQVFINIIDNAIKYGYVNSTIKVRCYTKNNDAIIEVEDKGDGIASKDIENIFQPFFRVNKKSSREKGGNGLGLAIVKAIVEKHDGKISVESQVKEWTKIIIEFPLL
ncbi:HAMP domain-containing protein [Clostridium botulinum]|uniref:HAMP domain-containing sensor histidine kinase n=1 Tax=Clostridium botulinum TaxID=1491 RepID=UPI00174DF331|nr:HAMP domain-containing sensor histidine kinase [Clostridium botulinum]MBD5638935.1 HAMP domain-containing protein [Clostridium botulinum]